MLGYRIKLTPDDNGTVLVTCPALPEMTSFGEDEADAMRRAVGAIKEALAARMADGEDIPEGHQRGPGLVRLPALTMLKAELYRQLRETGITRAELSRRVYSGQVRVGTIYRTDKKAEGRDWFWSLNGVENGLVRLDGFAVTLASAKAELTMSWRAWLAAAGLSEKERVAADAEIDPRSA